MASLDRIRATAGDGRRVRRRRPLAQRSGRRVADVPPRRPGCGPAARRPQRRGRVRRARRASSGGARRRATEGGDPRKAADDAVWALGGGARPHPARLVPADRARPAVGARRPRAALQRLPWPPTGTPPAGPVDGAADAARGRAPGARRWGWAWGTGARASTSRGRPSAGPGRGRGGPPGEARRLLGRCRRTPTPRPAPSRRPSCARRRGGREGPRRRTRPAARSPSPTSGSARSSRADHPPQR